MIDGVGPRPDKTPTGPHPSDWVFDEMIRGGGCGLDVQETFAGGGGGKLCAGEVSKL